MLTFICGRPVISTLRPSQWMHTLGLHTVKPKSFSAAAFQKLFSTSKPHPVVQDAQCIFVPISGKRNVSNLLSSLAKSGSIPKLLYGRPIFATVRTFSTTKSRLTSSGKSQHGKSNKTGLIYIIAVFIFMLGGAYAGVPLYKVFCQAAGLGGQAVKGHDIEKVETMEKVDRQIVVRFNADVASSMRWNFKPQQTEVTVHPGETALAFYTALNPTEKPIIGISTYNVLPYDAGQYFNKIQCFCFEEQRLNPKEQVDMPVFFYIDPEFAEDPKLEHVDIITLSYTFFEAKEGLQLPLPGYPQPHHSPAVAVT